MDILLFLRNIITSYITSLILYIIFIGHIFCKTCYKEYEETSKPPVPCPTCRAPVEMTFVSQRLSREINNLKVKCGNEDSECDWKGSLSDVKKHVINDCPYTFMVCKYCNDAGNPYRRMNKKKHYKICGKFPIVCQLCQMVIPRYIVFYRENFDLNIEVMYLYIYKERIMIIISI